MMVERQATNSPQNIIFRNQSAISRAVKEAKPLSRCLSSYQIYVTSRESTSLSKCLFRKQYFASLVCRDSRLKHFIKSKLPFCLTVIGCFYHVLNNHSPLRIKKTVESCKNAFCGASSIRLNPAQRCSFKPSSH